MRRALPAALLAFAAIGAGSAAAAPAKLAPPVISEPFTLLPCPSHPQTTLALEGCAEGRVVRTDRQIDTVVREMFPLLASNHARADLLAAQRAWLAYRQADCVSMSDLAAGGSFAVVAVADCDATVSKQRLAELRAFASQLAAP
jgi:uncharacterized protein YecT (DUF1311 family)